MSPGDWFQAASLVAVVVALVLNILQVRALSRQNASLASSLRQTVFQAQVQAIASSRIPFLWNDPRLLAWHLSQRGYGASTRSRNKKRLYVIVEIELHEFNYLNHEAGLLPEHVWTAWSKVLEADFALADFREVWPAARTFFAPPFVSYVDTLVAGRPAVRGVTANTDFISKVFRRVKRNR
jgi:hypothetical protein